MNVHLMPSAKHVRVANTRPEHIDGVCAVLRKAYGFPAGHEGSTFFRPRDIEQQIRRFPKGQFVALVGNTVVGMASTMLTDRSPYQKPLRWIDAIGDRGLRAHKPEET